MSELSVTIDMLPGRCAIEFTFCGPITCANARNIDTGVTGPLVTVDDTLTLRWADLDPDGEVAPEPDWNVATSEHLPARPGDTP